MERIAGPTREQARRKGRPERRLLIRLAGRPVVLAALLLAAAVLSVEDGFGRDAQNGARDRDRPTLPPPTELRVTEATATSIALMWKAPADEPRIEGYRLYTGDDADAEPVAKTTETEFTFTDLTCGTAYTLGVEAFGAGRRSERVPIVSATTACGDNEAPSTPAALVQAESTETSVRVSWTAATDRAGVISYSIYLAGLVVATTAELSYTFAGLQCGNSYSIGVSASDAAGNDSPQASLVITTKDCSRRGPPSAPTNLRQTDQTETSVALSWGGSNRAARYNVYRDGGRAGSTTDTSYSVSGLACGSSYTVGVEAEDAAGERSDAAKATVTTKGCSQPPPAPGRDDQAPSAPTGLQVTGVTDTSASLTWVDSTDNVGVTGYAVSADGVQLGSLAGTSYTFSGLVCGTTYKFGVAAYDAAGHRSEEVFAVVTIPECGAAGSGTEAPSDEGSAIAPPSDSGSATEAADAAGSDQQAPTVPRRLRLVEATHNSLRVAWRAATDDVGVQGYVLYLNGSEVGVSPGRRYRFEDLVCQTEYVVSVAAFDAAGNRSRPMSRAFSTSTCQGPAPDTEPPTPPGELAMTGATQTTVSVSWADAVDNVGVAGYDVYLNGDSVGSAATTSFDFTELTCGTSYSIDVQAYDEAGNRSESASAVVSTEACSDSEPPSTPTDLNVANRTRTSITVQWTAATDDVGVAGYRLYLNGADAGTTFETSHIFPGLSCATSYTIGVRAYDLAGNDSGLATVLATTSTCSDTIPPTTPTGLRRTAATPTTISLAWNASTDNVGVTGYGVYRSGTLVGTATSTTYTVTGLACGTSYAFAVDARDAAGNRSGRAPLNAATSACPPTGGDLLVAPGGSDANPCTAAAPCATFNRAYAVAQPGQTVEVAAGSYPAQAITGTKASPAVVFRPADGATVNIGSGAPAPWGQQTSINVQATNLRFESLRLDSAALALNTSDVTFSNLDAQSLQIVRSQRIRVYGGDYGPYTGNSGIRENGSADIVIDGASFHDHRAPGSSHIECLIVGAVNGLAVRNSKFWNCEVMDVYLSEFNGDIANVTFENNWFGSPLSPDESSYDWSWTLRFAGGYGYENIQVLHNSFNFLWGIGSPCSGCQILGNIGRLDVNSGSSGPGGCASGVPHSYNLWQNGTCSGTDRSLNGGAFPYANGSNGPSLDYHLTGGIAVDLVPGSIGLLQLQTDIDGQSRPMGNGSDAGSDELR